MHCLSQRQSVYGLVLNRFEFVSVVNQSLSNGESNGGVQTEAQIKMHDVEDAEDASEKMLGKSQFQSFQMITTIYAIALNALSENFSPKVLVYASSKLQAGCWYQQNVHHSLYVTEYWKVK